MAKKQTTTFHLLTMADSLKAQNDAIGLLLMRAHTARDLCGAVSDPEKLRELIRQVATEADVVRAAVWPGDVS